MFSDQQTLIELIPKQLLRYEIVHRRISRIDAVGQIQA